MPKNTETITVRCSPELKRNLKDLARANRNSLNNHCLTILRQAVIEETDSGLVNSIGPALKSVLHGEFEQLARVVREVSTRSAIESLVASQLLEFIIVDGKLLPEKDLPDKRLELQNLAVRKLRIPIAEANELAKRYTNVRQQVLTQPGDSDD